MENRTQYSPARAHQRFAAIDRALVLINQGPESLPYHILDVSEGGLSFRYLGKKLKHSEITRVSLYHNDKLIVHDLPINAVSDYRLHDNLVPVRRGSIIFKKLTAEQLNQLEIFIQRCTKAPLPMA